MELVFEFVRLLTTQVRKNYIGLVRFLKLKLNQATSVRNIVALSIAPRLILRRPSYNRTRMSEKEGERMRERKRRERGEWETELE